MIYLDEIISQLSREVPYLYQHRDDVESALINVEKCIKSGATRKAALDMAIKFPQIRPLGLIINLNKSQFDKVINKIFKNDDQQNYVLLLTKRISNQKKLKKAFSSVMPASFNQPTTSKNIKKIPFRRYFMTFSIISIFLILLILLMIDLRKCLKHKAVIITNCSYCYKIDNTTFSFEYYHDSNDVYDRIVYKEITPVQFIHSISEKQLKYRLPKIYEIQKLINSTKVPIRYSFFYTIPDVLRHNQLIGKKVYIQGNNKYNFPVAVVNQNYTLTNN